MEAPPAIPNESNNKIPINEDLSISNIKKETHSQNSEQIKFEKPNFKNEKQEIQNEITKIQNESPNIQNEQPIIQNEKANIQMGNEYATISTKNNNNIYETQEIPSDIKLDVNQIDKPENENENKKCCRLSCSNLSMRSAFMVKVYGILCTQFIFTFGLLLITQINIIKEYLLSKSVLGIVLLCIASVIFLTTFIIFLCNPKLLQKVPVNYIILLIITVCETVILVYVAAFYPSHYVIGAMAFVIAICVGIFFISTFNKIDIGYLYFAIISLCDLAFTYGLLAFIYRSYYLHFLYCLLGGIVFCLYIVFDTIMIRDHFSYDDYILAAMTLYFDIIRLFIQILRILGSKGQKNGH